MYSMSFLSTFGHLLTISVWKGAIVVGEDDLPNPTFHTLVLSTEEGQTGVKLTAGEEGAEFVLASCLVYR